MNNINSYTPIRDFLFNIYNPNTWFQIAVHDIKQRYKRSKIGPFWITISTSIIVIFLSSLYSQLLNVNLKEYLPYIGVSLVLWNLFSTVLNESCDTFVSSKQMLLQLRLPFYFYVFRLVCRNFIILFHNFLLLAVILFFYPNLINPILFLTLPITISLYFLSGISVGIILGVLCTRFRDITQLILNLVQLSFFVTPILWKRDMVDLDKQWIIDFNIFNHFIDIFRLPFLNQGYPINSLLIVFLFTTIMFFLSFLFFCKFKKKINFWL